MAKWSARNNRCDAIAVSTLLNSENMNHNAVKLVQESWTRVENLGPTAAELFHSNLLLQRPWLTALYQGYVDDRDAMVLKTFGRALRGMENLHTHTPLLMQIGRINAQCGVQSHHYPYFEVALSQTLGQVLGDAYSGRLREAWSAVFGAMTRLMLAGANGDDAVTVAVRQQAADRRSQRRRSAMDMGGNRGYHRRTGPETNRRALHMPAVRRGA